MSIITAEGLRYKYPGTDRLALDNLDFAIEQGEFIGIIGRNGAGKSTLCQALIGLVPHFYKGSYGGRVVVAGIEVGNSDIHELSQRIGLIFQDPFTQVTGSKLTVIEEVAFGMEHMGVARKDMVERAHWAMSLLGISDLEQQNPYELSGGQMQRVAIASIIAMKPRVIILDEPTSQLDPQGSEEVFRAIDQLKHEGHTIIMVSQDMEVMAEYADRLLLLSDGQLVDDAQTIDVYARSDLADYGVRPPRYTEICRQIRPSSAGRYPITMKGAYEWLVTTDD